MLVCVCVCVFVCVLEERERNNRLDKLLSLSSQQKLLSFKHLFLIGKCDLLTKNVAKTFFNIFSLDGIVIRRPGHGPSTNDVMLK